MRQKVKEMEEEAAKLREMQAQVEKEMTTTDSSKLGGSFVSSTCQVMSCHVIFFFALLCFSFLFL